MLRGLQKVRKMKQNKDIVQKTLEALQVSTVPRTKIAEETGLGYHWLAAFGQGKIKDPSARKISTLYEFLTGEVLA